MKKKLFAVILCFLSVAFVNAVENLPDDYILLDFSEIKMNYDNLSLKTFLNNNDKLPNTDPSSILIDYENNKFTICGIKHSKINMMNRNKKLPLYNNGTYYFNYKEAINSIGKNYHFSESEYEKIKNSFFQYFSIIVYTEIVEEHLLSNIRIYGLTVIEKKENLVNLDSYLSDMMNKHKDFKILDFNLGMTKDELISVFQEKNYIFSYPNLDDYFLNESSYEKYGIHVYKSEEKQKYGYYQIQGITLQLYNNILYGIVLEINYENDKQLEMQLLDALNKKYELNGFVKQLSTRNFKLSSNFYGIDITFSENDILFYSKFYDNLETNEVKKIKQKEIEEKRNQPLDNI